jgi:hypothetical protein
MPIMLLDDLTVDRSSSLADAYKAAGFTWSRIHGKLRDESAYPQTAARTVPVLAHHFKTPAGLQLSELANFMQDDLMVTPPENLRDVIALGNKVEGVGSKAALWIYAPKITGEDRLFLQLQKYPEWMGLTVRGFDPDDVNLWDLNLVGFSKT